jgi:AcrR family transcriptional regulator
MASLNAPPTLRNRATRAVRAEIAAVAIRLFLEQGFEKTTVDQIAVEAGLSRTSFFRYFATKEDVLLGHLEELGQKVRDALAARPARVVTVSSSEHRGGSIHFDDLTGERSYSPRAFYQQSKLANVLFGLELDRRVRAAGIGVRSVIAHPGYSDTNLQSTGPTGVARQLMKVSNRLIAQSAAMGALSELYAAVDPAAQSGRFYGPGGFLELRGYPAEGQPSAAARNEETARRLWEISEQLTGVTWNLPAAPPSESQSARPR